MRNNKEDRSSKKSTESIVGKQLNQPPIDLNAKIVEIEVDKNLCEKSRTLHKLVSKAVKTNSNIHISAPIGTWKTTFAMEIAKLYSERGYDVVILEPQKAITEQVEKKLIKDGVYPFVLNGETFQYLEGFEEDNYEMPKVYLSTFDSAWRLFEYDDIYPERKVIVIIDETHTILTKGRPLFDKSIKSILDLGYPIIGITATISNWVLNYIIPMGQRVEVSAIDLHKIKLFTFNYPNTPMVIAEIISKHNLKKVVIWTENIVDQNKIKEAIKSTMKDKKVCILNSKTNKSEEKDVWDYLMDNDLIKPGIDVIIINSVAQAGININNEDIDQVFLTGNFDPYGFVQYLGRCRKYKGEYHYVHNNYGKKKGKYRNPKELEDELLEYQTVLDSFDNAGFSSLIAIDPNGSEIYSKVNGKKGYQLNKCVTANIKYESLRELKAPNMLEWVRLIDPSIEIKEGNSYTDIKLTSPAENKAQNRMKKRSELHTSIKKRARYLKDMIKFFPEIDGYESALNVVKESLPVKRDAIKKSVLHIPPSKVKGVKQVIENAKKAQVNIHRVIIAAKRYWDSGKKDTVLTNVLDKMSKDKFVKLRDAYDYFRRVDDQSQLIIDLYDKYKNCVGDCKYVIEWKDDIAGDTKLSGLPNSIHLANMVYNCCFLTKRVKDKVGDQLKNKQKLFKVITTFDEYVKAHGFDDIF